MHINLKQSFYSSLSVAHRTGLTRSTVLHTKKYKCNEFEEVEVEKVEEIGEAVKFVLPFF